MGFDIDRFVGPVDEELKCQICMGVLEDPLQALNCEHTFCRQCINVWLKNSNTCPIDRENLKTNQLQQIPRIIRNLINHLKIKCDFIECNKVISLEEKESHKLVCSFNPESPVDCPKKCGALVPKNRLNEHDCIKELRELSVNQQKQICELNLSFNELLKNLEKLQELSLSNSKFVKELNDRYNQLELSINNLEQPIQEIILFTKNESNCEENMKNIQKLASETTVNIYICSLNRQITSGILREYLSRQDIHVIDCRIGRSVGNSNDFLVTILKTALNKILVPELWPKGVHCFICGKYYDSKIDGTNNLVDLNLMYNNW